MALTVLPAVVGLFELSQEVVLFISSESYLEAAVPLRILSIALVASLFGWLYNTCVLVPWKREGQFFGSNACECNFKRGAEHPAHPAVPGECGGLYHPAGRAVLHDALHPLLQGPGYGLC